MGVAPCGQMRLHGALLLVVAVVAASPAGTARAAGRGRSPLGSVASRLRAIRASRPVRPRLARLLIGRGRSTASQRLRLAGVKVVGHDVNPLDALPPARGERIVFGVMGGQGTA